MTLNSPEPRDVKPRNLDPEALALPHRENSSPILLSGEETTAIANRNSRQLVKRNYAELEASEPEPSDEREFFPTALARKKGRPRKSMAHSRKRPTFSRPTMLKSNNQGVGDDSDRAKSLFTGDFYNQYRPHWGGKKRRRKNDELSAEDIIDDSDDKPAKDALLAELFSQDITHGYEHEDERLECFLKPDKRGGLSPKRPLNVYFLYRMDIASLVDRFARLHKDPIRVDDDLFVLLKECCQLIPHFKEGMYTGNAKTLACTRRWDELKATMPAKLKFFELLEQEYKELYQRVENFVDYHYNPNKEYTPPPQLLKRSVTFPPSTPAKPFDRSATNTPHPGDEDDGYIYPTAQGQQRLPVPITSGGYHQPQFTFQTQPVYSQYHASGGGYEGHHYPVPNNSHSPQYQLSFDKGYYVQQPPSLSTYQFPPAYPPTNHGYYLNPNNLRAETPYSGGEFTPSPSAAPEELVDQPPSPEHRYDANRFYTERLPVDFDEGMAGRRRSSARVSRLLQ